MRSWMIPFALLAGASPLAAQADCTLGHLPESSNEAEIFRIRGVSTVFGRAASPMALRPKALMLLFEATTLPTVDDATATPSYCRAGKPAENVNLMGVLPRPRAIFGLADGFTLEVSWIPPVTVNNVKANVIGLALARAVPMAAGLVSIRGSATFGAPRMKPRASMPATLSILAPASGWTSSSMARRNPRASASRVVTSRKTMPGFG